MPMAHEDKRVEAPTVAPDIAVLDRIARHVLWLSTAMVHHANNVRPNLDGAKIGGHQASSASSVGIMTALYFDFLREGDRIAVKPHASPVFHAIQFLLGNLDPRYLTTLRAFHGLQAYPSRTKDPDPVDFSGGSMGLPPVAPNFASLVGQFVEDHFGNPPTVRPRFVAMVGDAELDEGSVWEAIAEPSLSGLDNVIWIIDYNRQSLDRVVPEIRTPKLEAMFRANGWHVIEAKYGHLLQEAFAVPNGELLRRAVDVMPNAAYQRMLRAPAREVRERLCASSDNPAALQHLLEQWSDAQLAVLVRNLAGHDVPALRQVLREADQASCPAVIFAYTIKGWGLPIEGDPMNHSALLSHAQMEELRLAHGIPAGDPFVGFDAASPEAALCRAAAERLGLGKSSVSIHAQTPPRVPTDLGISYSGAQSTQAALGQILVALARTYPDVGRRIVTTSPDVATSTNLGGWINRVGVWGSSKEPDYFGDAGPRPQQWVVSRSGQHIELGISENNLFLLLGQLGLAQEMHGELLLPIGTLYDPFVARGLDALIYSVYSGAHFIFAGTPSGVTLSPEGGAHQSIITPSIGLALPGLVTYEPCFAKELEWIVLAGLASLADREEGECLYLRLTTRSVDQGLMPIPADPAAVDRLRRAVLAGAYRLIDHAEDQDYLPGRNVVHIFASGAVIPEAIAAVEALRAEGVCANLVNVTSADRLYRGYQASVVQSVHGEGFPHAGPLSSVVTEQDAHCPIVAVLDGHPQALTWIGGALGTRVLPLGVTRFGESGTRDDLYRACSIDAQSIVEAALLALD
jgi:pyruvate dehydrogenase E1 component